jgi:hypothetical protein
MEQVTTSIPDQVANRQYFFIFLIVPTVHIVEEW